MSTTGLRSLVSWVVAVCVCCVGIFFWRDVTDVFETPKATILWVVALIVSPALAGGWLVWFRTGANRRLWSMPFLLVAYAFAGALAFSGFVGSSLWGQYTRYVGVATLAAGLAIAMAVWITDDRGFDRIAAGLITSAFVSALFVWLQVAGLDPFTWTSYSASNEIFGTLGNPNFSSAWLAIVVPLAHWMSVRTDLRALLRWTARATVAVGVAAIGSLDSFQGSVGLAGLGLAMFGLGCIGPGSRGVTRIVTVLTFGFFVAVSLSVHTTSRFVVVSIAGVGLLTVLDRLAAGRWLTRVRFGRTGGFVATAVCLAGVASGLFVVRDRLGEGLADGFEERGDFYRTALNAIGDRPFTGYGLDTFGRYFVKFRPESYALRFEGSRPSSPHSVYIGMLFSGGVLLAALFMSMIAVGFWKSFSVWKRSSWQNTTPLVLLACWLAMSLVFIVSIENSPLIALFFVLYGAILRLGGNTGSRTEPKMHRRRQSSRVNGAAVVVVAVLALVGAFFSLRPLRASQAAWNSLTTSSVGGALSESVRAVELMPSVPLYRVQAATIANKILDEYPDDPNRGLLISTVHDNALAAAQLLNYQGSSIPTMANLLGKTGDFEAALDVVDKAIDYDPHGPSIRNFALEILPKISARAVEQGAPDLARRAEALLAEVSSAS